MTQVKLKVTVVLTVDLEDGFNISPADIIENVDYDFTSQTSGAIISNTEIRDMEIINAK